MIKAFLFDYDGVVTQGVSDGTLASRLAGSLHISPDVASKWINDIWTPLLTGKMSEFEAFEYFSTKYGKNINTAQQDIWFTWADLTPLPAMTELLQTLKAMGYRLGVLSNATAYTKQQISSNGGYDPFDFVVISSEVGAKKPDPQIFKIALKKLPGIQPSEVVFLDDRLNATIAAAELGFKAIHVTEHSSAIAEIKQLIRQA